MDEIFSIYIIGAGLAGTMVVKEIAKHAKIMNEAKAKKDAIIKKYII